MKKVFALLALLVFALTACAPSFSEGELDALATQNAMLQEQISAANDQIATAQALNDQLAATPTETPVPTAEPTATAAPTATAETCAPNLWRDLHIGFIPALDYGDKKSAVIVGVDCNQIAITFEGGAYLYGHLNSDGTAINDCLFYDPAKPNLLFPCKIDLRNNLEARFLNATGTFEKQSGKNEWICLAEESRGYSVPCER